MVRGLPLEAQDSIDTGRKRRLADILRIEGYTDTHALAAAVNMLYRYRNGLRLDYSQNSAPSAKQALHLIESEPGMREGVTAARYVTREVGGPIGVFAALHCEFTSADPIPAEEFFLGLEKGESLEQGDPLLSLRRQLIRLRTDRLYTPSPFAVAGLTIKAFNLRRNDSTVSVLSFRKTEAMPRVEPRVRRAKGDR